VLSLKKLLQIDTQAIHQEKLKSYVYIRTTSLNPSEYQGKMHNCLDSKIIILREWNVSGSRPYIRKDIFPEICYKNNILHNVTEFVLSWWLFF